MNFEEEFKSWTLDQKVEWALEPNICNLSENMRFIIVDLKAENERMKAELKQIEAQDQVVIDSLRKENAKLRCAVLHGLYLHCEKRAFEADPYLPTKWEYYWTKFEQAYRKAKKELKEGK